MAKGILLLTLRTFSATGGIEKVSRQLGKALYELTHGTGRKQLAVLSMYDQPEEINEQYFPAAVFRGYGKKKALFVWAAVREGISKDKVILSHVNLLLAGYLIKLLSPKTRLVLMAHGIEVWKKFPAWKKKMLDKCDLVLTVSQFTREKMIAANGIAPGKVKVLNNCLDPFLPLPGDGKNPLLLERYGLKYDDIILMTLSRLSSREKYKGYDNVMCSIHQLKQQYPQLKYLVVGKYDTEEKERLDRIISELDLTGRVVFAGFIPDNELSAHFELADLYIMPSKKEGFGIVFIEAMYYGKPVIAGNKDGSVDALCNGKFGLLVNPDETGEITTAIAQVLEDATAFIPDRYEIIAKFSFEKYKENLEALLFRNG